MGRRKHRSKYESGVHLGFLAIVSLLVFLNFVSNYIIFQARVTQHEEALSHVRRAAVTVSRDVQACYPEPLTPEALAQARDRNGLSSLTLLPVKPADNSRQAKRDWFRTVIRQFPPSQHPDLADKLYRANLQELSRGSESEYYYLYPVPAGAGGSLLVLTIERPDLAFLDDSREVLMFVLIGALAVVSLMYAALSRFMFRPFRRLKEQAEQAGRPVDDTPDETEAVVEEYERVIRQLTLAGKELERLHAEASERADALELFNRYLMESSRSGVITLDREGQVVAVSETAIEMLGLPPETGRAGGSYIALLAGRERLIEDIKTALRGDGTPGYREYAGLIAERPEAHLGVTLTDIQDRVMGTTGLLLLINDLTEVSQLRRELEGRKRLAALGEMAGGLAHQIRNSLGAIGGYGTLLKRRLKRDGLDAGPAQELVDETQEAGELINRFLSFARPFEYSPEPVKLRRLLEEVLESTRIRPDSAGLETSLSCPDGLTVEADAILLKQALGNVVDNAVSAYDDRRGLVEVGVMVEPNRVEVTVRDYGCGIPGDEIDKIFTPFFSSRPSGTGLGLPLVAKIIDLHTGKIDVESDVGRGSIFRISLPLNAIRSETRHPSEISGSV